MNNKYVLIDGENFVHGLVHVLRSKKIISNREELGRIHVASLLTDMDVQGSVINYYTTRIQVPEESSSLHETVEKMRNWNAKWTPYLANQGVTIIKAGILKARTSKRCSHCQKRTEILLEKGVDVRLGVDIVALGLKDTTLYVFSSDSDIISAIKSARAHGAKVIYVAIEGSINHGLSKSTDGRIVLKKSQVIDAYKKVNA